MTTRDRSRTLLVGAAVAALLAPLAIVAAMASPASAAQMKQHEVYMYKVEKHVDLVGEYPEGNLHEHLYCNPGDIALDGMWRVDNVEQANPPETNGDERDVYFTASYGDAADRRMWHFRARNYADGIAQIKLFVTCIRGNVEQAFLHSHQVRVSAQAPSTTTRWPRARATGSTRTPAERMPTPSRRASTSPVTTTTTRPASSRAGRPRTTADGSGPSSSRRPRRSTSRCTCAACVRR